MIFGSLTQWLTVLRIRTPLFRPSREIPMRFATHPHPLSPAAPVLLLVLQFRPGAFCGRHPSARAGISSSPHRQLWRSRRLARSRARRSSAAYLVSSSASSFFCAAESFHGGRGLGSAAPWQVRRMISTRRGSGVWGPGSGVVAGMVGGPRPFFFHGWLGNFIGIRRWLGHLQLGRRFGLRLFCRQRLASSRQDSILACKP